jgi:hypothetical protein
MVPLNALDSLQKLPNPGYISVYMFSEDAALKIKQSGTSKGLQQYPVAADELVIDIDNGDEGLAEVEVVLEAQGLAYQVWSSGGKGYHVCIPHPLVCSEDLPYSHQQAVQGLGLKVDMSLYQHGRLISMPGRVHPKTKQKKRFIRQVEGKNLDLKIVKKPDLQFNFDDRAGLDELASGLMRVVNMLNTPPSPGNRHTKMWGAAKDLADAGLQFDTVLDVMGRVNESWDVQKDEAEIRLAIEQAFKTTGGR